jgi:poly-gamma-glutamate capsule biosynthesis protein CapA/YwtB (metallophosphatase superfamily)
MNNTHEIEGRKALLGFVGDVLVDRDNPAETFEPVREILAVPDILSGNLEGVYSDDPHQAPSVGISISPGTQNLNVFSEVGFDVMSMANNHIADLGHAAMLETRKQLNAQGVATCGAGETLAAARAPAILDVGGLRVAYLSYASVFPCGYEARFNVPGLAPVRAYNLYHESLPNYNTPGALPRIQTVPDETDLANLREDIASARAAADIVVGSFHWGDYARPIHLTDHELDTARMCAEEGMDIVIGHHHHILRGMEWHAGKPIFYGLGHFVFDIRAEFSEVFKSIWDHDPEDPDFYGMGPRKGWPLLPFHAESRMTALAWVDISGGSVNDAGFLPCMLNPDGQVRPVAPDSPEGRKIVDYVRRGCEAHDLNARLETEEAVTLASHPTVRLAPARP